MIVRCRIMDVAACGVSWGDEVEVTVEAHGQGSADVLIEWHEVTP